MAFAAATELGGRLARRTEPFALSATTTLVGAVLLLPLGLGLTSRGADIVPGDVTTLVILAYLGLFTMALTSGLLYSGLRTTPGSSAVMATLIEPVTAAFVAHSCSTSVSVLPALQGRACSWVPSLGCVRTVSSGGHSDLDTA